MKKIYLVFPIIAGIMFGSTGIFVRTLTENGIDSTTLLFLRFSIAIIYLLIAILIADKTFLKINKHDISLFIICGLSILGLNLCYNQSINTVPLSLAAILLSTAPVFVLVFEYFLFGEKISSVKVLSVILVLIGCTLVTGFIEENSIDISLIGVITGIGAAIFWAMYSVSSRKSIDIGKHTFTILFYSLIIITIVTIPFTNFTQINNFISLNTIPNILYLLLHSLISFALPYILITISLNHLDAGTAVILSSGEPIAALVFGTIFYLEIPTLLMTCGVIITIAALIILSRSSSNKSETQIETQIESK
ncbi:DMT family transporter [Methanobrevibacter olleyae]|uniref:EamA-like transporter family protein n=1 Tax=Methanobrevibacter olleyae TaxID=294671 RepID=A0A126R0N9_METOL|nr:DMT family transporter [Methanobrevibacter olleyae]AMK15637.1 EamA-like transporter family protein [Methanobrevibacter olleyae]SFL24225.1 Threonine/homoserine efflux transporter RhtA [Methanobrevibacter olleyae]